MSRECGCVPGHRITEPSGTCQDCGLTEEEVANGEGRECTPRGPDPRDIVDSLAYAVAGPSRTLAGQRAIEAAAPSQYHSGGFVRMFGQSMGQLADLFSDTPMFESMPCRGFSPAGVDHAKIASDMSVVTVRLSDRAPYTVDEIELLEPPPFPDRFEKLRRHMDREIMRSLALPSCRHGVIMYGTGCVTCERERIAALPHVHITADGRMIPGPIYRAGAEPRPMSKRARRRLRGRRMAQRRNHP